LGKSALVEDSKVRRPGDQMELAPRITQIESRRQLVVFISALRKDLETNPDNWENPSLPRFPEAMAAFA